MKSVIDTNYRGHVKLTAYLLPFCSIEAKIMFTSARLSKLEIFRKEFGKYME